MTQDTRGLGLQLGEFLGKPVDRALAAPASALTGAMSALQNAFAELEVTPQQAIRLEAEIRSLTETLQEHAGAEEDRFFGRMVDVQSRGQTFAPVLSSVTVGSSSAVGIVRFGSFYGGPRGAVHGGAVMAFLDEALGWLVRACGRPRCRTAYLKTDFRAVTPANVDLEVSLTLREEVGRKMYLAGTIKHGDTICAQSEGLFLHMLDGQL